MPAGSTKARRRSTGKKGQPSSEDLSHRPYLNAMRHIKRQRRMIASSPSAEAKTAPLWHGNYVLPVSGHSSLLMDSYSGLTWAEAISMLSREPGSTSFTGVLISQFLGSWRVDFLSSEATPSSTTTQE